MFHNVVLVGRAGFETDQVRDMLADDPSFNVEVFDTASAALTRLSQGNLSLVVLNFELFNREKIGLIHQFRDSGFEYPTLILARVIAKDVYGLIESTTGALLLEKPAEKRRLWGVIKKMVYGESVKQPVHRRYYTDQPVAISKFSDDSSSSIAGRIFNLSQGGAYIEVDNTKKGFKVGDMIRFSIRLTELSKQHMVSGKVVWATPTGEKTGAPGIGVTFVKSGDVYTEMMKKI